MVMGQGCVKKRGHSAKFENTPKTLISYFKKTGIFFLNERKIEKSGQNSLKKTKGKYLLKGDFFEHFSTIVEDTHVRFFGYAIFASGLKFNTLTSFYKHRRDLVCRTICQL